MPSEPDEPVQVEYTPEFKRNLRVLAKKYRLNERFTSRTFVTSAYGGVVS
ncbi:MAG: hypothetical protein ACUVXI_12130 [bacterium]